MAAGHVYVITGRAVGDERTNCTGAGAADGARNASHTATIVATPATAQASAALRWRGAGLTAAAPAPATVKVALPSASANSFAVANRSAGSFSRALASADATFGGTDFRICVTACAGSAMILMIICCALPPMCGGWPASISYSTDASE
jgi:hypothetical protein